MSEKLTKEQWVNNLCREHKIIDTRPLTPPQVQEWLQEYNQFFGGMCTEESFRRLLRKGKRNLLMELSMLPEDDEEAAKDPDEELIEANVKFQKQKQKFQDTNRVERKSFREYARVENAVSAYAEELVKLLKERGEELYTENPDPNIINDDYNEVGLLQVTDTHFNELIDLTHNQYDMKIASQRLFKLFKEATSMFTARNISKVVVAFTGDLLNSDRRLDEILNQATNRAKATFVSVALIKSFLTALTYHFDVSVVSVLGNESRVGKELPFSNEALSDNYDFTIINMVRLLMEASSNPNIEFGSLDTVDTTIEVNGHKIFVTHDMGRATATQKGTQSVIGMKYLQGTPIDFAIGGHIHGTMNQTFGARSGSLCGSNSYSDVALYVAGKAAQNIYFIGNDYIHTMSIDLQHTKEDEWFDINTELMEYHAKSLDKTKKKTTVMSVVI